MFIIFYRLRGMNDTDPVPGIPGSFQLFADLLPVADEQDAQPVQLDMFTDYEALAAAQKAADEERSRERKQQEVVLSIKEKWGKNASLRGMNFSEGATARERNAQVGGHKA